MPGPIQNESNSRVYEDMIEDDAEMARLENEALNEVDNNRAGKLPTGKHMPHADRSVRLK
jgi:hypothetical protein